jgi:ATP-dependent DNA helicase RecQ
MTPLQTLQKFWGYPKFRKGQLKIINSILNDKDTLAILPTGGGKSVCYQVPGLIKDGQTLVISPLISLMKDQVEQLQQRNITAVYLNSSLPKSELKQLLKNLDQYKFIYLSPERLHNRSFIKTVKKLEISLIAVDEAHCISLWGHDFRPEYQQINQFINQLSTRPTIAALTATATSLVQKDIINSLQLQNPNIFQNSFARHNLNLITHYTQTIKDKELALLTILKAHPQQNGIIYCSTRNSTKYVSRLINHFFPNLNSGFYHGGLNNKQRSQIQEKFVTGKIKIITATNAFGMGVDKSDVRFVVHWQIPSCLENYYQEAGRAGRDHQPAHCYLLASPHDLTVPWQFINLAPPLRKKHLQHQLQAMIQYIITPTCKQNFILNYFGEKTTHPCHHCSNCRPLQTQLNTSYTQILQPQTKSQYLKIPGFGLGWYNCHL